MLGVSLAVLYLLRGGLVNSSISVESKGKTMKVYVHYEEGSDAELHVTLKLTLPKKWHDESPVKLLQVQSVVVQQSSGLHRERIYVPSVRRSNWSLS